MEDSKEHHVHFMNNEEAGKNNEIVIQKKDNKFDVHLGFLQVNHRYKISFSIPKMLCQSSNDSQVIIENTPTNNPHLEITCLSVSHDQIHFQLELFAYKEKLLVEDFCFSLSDTKDPHTVVLNARVLGKGKGTPLLKNEIHLIHNSVEEESGSSSDS